MIRHHRSVMMLATVLAGLVLASGAAEATMNNGSKPGKSTIAAQCLARYHLCYRHCDGWYKGDPAEINSCKTRTCDYQYINCVPQ